MLKERIVRVAFTTGIAPSESEYFDEIIAYKKKTLWFLLLFITRTMIPIANGIQTSYYLKINKVEGTCYIPELENNSWTFKQIVRISKKYGNNSSEEVGLCEYLDYDYTLFEELTYSEALELKESLEVPEIKTCSGQDILLYENTNKYRHLDIPFCHSIVLANRMFLLKNVSLMIGSIVFGILGDLFGRRKIAIIVASIWLVSSFCLGLFPDTVASEFFYTATNCFNRSLDLLTYINLFELCHKKIRFFTVLTFYGTTGVFVFFTRFAYMLNFNWNYLLHISSCFSLVSLFHCWYVPESPRWLINQSRYKDALDVLKEVIGRVPNEILFEDEGSETAFYFEIFTNSFRYLTKRKIRTMIIMTIISAIFGFVDASQIMRVVQSQYAANGAVTAAIAYFLSFFYTMIIYGAFGKKYGLFWTIITLSFSSFVMLCLRDFTTKYDIRANTFLLLTTCTAEMFVLSYLPDLFPTFLRCTTLGVIYFFSSIVRILTVELIDWKEVSKTNVFLSFLLISLPGLSVLKLHDTTLSDLLTTRLFRV